jgi:hypothetical protein
LSALAEAAVVALAAAPDAKARAKQWRGMTANQTIGVELRRFSDAAQQRFGDETVRCAPGAVCSRSRRCRASTRTRLTLSAALSAQSGKVSTPASGDTGEG